MKHDKIILLVGRSGSGKSTVADILSRQYGRSILPSYTTRPKRFEKEEGHIFVNNMFYEKVSRSRDIVAYTYFDKHHYWATTQQVDENDIYIIDPDGVAFFRSHYFGPKQVVWLRRVAPRMRSKDGLRSTLLCSMIRRSLARM